MPPFTAAIPMENGAQRLLETASRPIHRRVNTSSTTTNTRQYAVHFHNDDILLLVSLGNCPACSWACFTPKMVPFPSGVRLEDLTLSWLNRTPGVCQLAYGQLNCCIPGDKNHESHQTTTSSPAMQTNIWASNWAGKKGKPSLYKSPTSQVEISLVSLPNKKHDYTYLCHFDVLLS